MTKSFNCATCSAPLEFAGTTTQRCRYCGSTVIAPPELFYASGSSTPFGDLSSLTGKAVKIAEIDQLIHDGRKIDAIKVFRETFGVGLREAKDAVERMERGESVDISGMKVRSTRAANAAVLEKVKTIGYTIGGSILVTILVTVLIIAGVTGAIFYFAWTVVDTKIAPLTGSPAPGAKPTPTPTPTPDMIEVLKFGGEGNGAARFKDNRHVAVDGKGRIYSSDYSPHRIQVFDAEGKFLSQWAPETGSNLYDLTADREGNVYLANDKGIFKHDGESGALKARSEKIYSHGIALTWDGKIVAVARKSILVLDTSLKVLAEYKDAAERANSTFGFEKVAVDGAGMIYALDSHNDDICKFSADGKFLDRFPSGANTPHALAFDPNGRLFISDTSSIKVLDPGGQVLKTLPSYQAFGLAFNQQGELFVASRPHVLKHKLNF